MKKILLISHNPHYAFGGIENYNFNLINILNKIGKFQITEYSFHMQHKPLIVRDKIENVEIIESNFYDNNSSTHVKWFKLHKHACMQVKNLLAKNKYDLIINSVNMFWYRKCALPRDKTIFIQHFSNRYLDFSAFTCRFFAIIGYNFLKYFLRLTCGIEQANNVVSYTKADELKLQKRFGDKNFFNIPLFSDVINKTKNMNEITKIIWVGRINNYQKKIKMLIKIAKYLNYEIHVYGNDSEINLFANNKKYKNVKYCGFYKQNELIDIYKKYNYSITVSKYESFPFSITESLCNATPVIVRDTFECANFLGSEKGLIIEKQ
jgi:glycosyltransferase involved in cell wall biosynthesis